MEQILYILYTQIKTIFICFHMLLAAFKNVFLENVFLKISNFVPLLEFHKNKKMQYQKVESSFDLSISGAMIAQSTSSYMASRRVVHIMLRSSLLNILYRRLNLDERYFITNYFDDVPFIRFKKTPKNIKDRLIAYYMRWVIAIKHAIDRKYLKEVFLYMKSPSGDIMEAYRFTLKYNPKGDKAYLSMIEPPEVKLKAMALFDVIRRLGDAGKLGDDTDPDLHLTYNNGTPKGYTPPGFITDTHPLPSLERTGHTLNDYGSINTGFHYLKCYGSGVISYLHDISLTQSNRENQCALEMDTEELIPPVNFDENEVKNRTDESDKSCVLTDGISPMENSENMEEIEAGPSQVLSSGISPMKTSSRVRKEQMLDQSTITVEGSNEEDIVSLSSEGHYDCILCELQFEDIELLTCSKCYKTHHSVCHGYWNVDGFIRDNFLCNNCGNSDVKLNNVPTQLKIHLPKIRLLLYHAKKDNVISNRIMESFCRADKITLETLMRQQHLINADNSVNMEVLNALCAAIFIECNNSQYFE